MVFEISGDTIYFEAIDPHYADYKNGAPACTIRGLTKDELECIGQANIKHIEINRVGDFQDSFRRDVTNIKVADMYRLYDMRVPVVFSWKHPDPSDEILSRAISHYGEPAQVLKCIEELAELIHELTTSIYSTHDVAGQSIQFISRASDTIADECRRFILPYNETLNKRQPDIGKIVSELADVSITTSQMLKIFNCLEEVEKIKQEKLSRLEERMRGDSQ